MGLAEGAQPILDQGRVGQHPAVQGGVVHLQTALQEQLLDVAVAERVAQVPRDGLQDQRCLEVPALEIVLRPALQLLGNRAQDHRPPPVRRRICGPQAHRGVNTKNFATRPATGPTYRTTLRATIRSSYRGHYRRAVLDLLAVLDFRSNNDVHRPVIRAFDLIRRYAETRVRAYPVEEDVPLDGIVRPLWRDAVVDQDPQGRPRIDRITYEICALEALRDQLRCKEVWVAGANRYRNPDEDLPADFDAQRAGHYQALDLPLDASAFIDGLREEMHAALAQLDQGLPRNPDVRLTSKRGGWISLTPLLPRPSPANIEALKAEVADTWPLTSLLDIVKEADLRLGFTDR